MKPEELRINTTYHVNCGWDVCLVHATSYDQAASILGAEEIRLIRRAYHYRTYRATFGGQDYNMVITEMTNA